MVSTFGNFIRFYVKLLRNADNQQSTTRPNTFEIMLQAQRDAVLLVLPEKVAVRNKRDELFNDLVELIEKEGLVWKSSEVQCGIAANVLNAIRDALWYLDGHHHTLADQACRVPAIFSSFEGYNKPEKSKHEKRSAAFLSADTLTSHSQRLYGNLQLPFWSRQAWCGFKTEVELLAQAVAKYAGSLSVKKSRINVLHISSVPARTVADNLTVEYLSPRLSVPRSICAFDEAVQAAGMNVAVDIDHLLPRDRRKRYDVIQDMKKEF